MVEDTKVELQVIRPINNTVNCTICVDWPIGHKTWVDLQYIANIGKMYGILHPENNKYRMNVPATCFAPIYASDFKGPFKVGDWVEITKSNKNWASSMDNFVGKKVQITDVWNNGWGIRFKEDTHRFSWNYYQGHFIPCESQMLTTMHSKYEDIDLNIEEEEEREGRIIIKSNLKYSSISNILKRIQI